MKANARTIAAVGAALLAAGLVIFLGGGHGTGARGPEPDSLLPAFAAPLAASTLVGDANVSSQACSVADRRALVGCRAYADRPFVLGFIAEDDPRCRRLLGSLSGLRGVATAVVGIRGSRPRLAGLARTAPTVTVAWDRDGALANRMGVAVCPTAIVTARGGKVAGTLIGDGIDDPSVLSRKVDELLEARRSGVPPQ